MTLGEFCGCAGVSENLLGVLCVFLLSLLKDGLRGAINESLSFTEAKTGQVLNSLDNSYLLGTSVLQDNVPFSLLFSSSGFIHPLQSPAGEVLSRIQAPDHWHHYGIWNPWTHTEFEGDTIDFWNIGSGQGRVRSAALIERTSGNVFGDFRALHEHIAGNRTRGEKVALKEQWEVRVWNTDPGRGWVIDFASTLSPATDSPLARRSRTPSAFSANPAQRAFRRMQSGSRRRTASARSVCRSARCTM